MPTNGRPLADGIGSAAPKTPRSGARPALGRTSSFLLLNGQVEQDGVCDLDAAGGGGGDLVLVGTGRGVAEVGVGVGEDGGSSAA